ncbi:MAG: hypothetical protein V1787_01795 [Candidatus Micrarchaeota archaeon]
MRLFVLALLLAALPFLPQAISSEQAKAVAERYLLKGEVAVIGQYNPIEDGSERFWLIYLAPQDSPQTKNLIVLVREEGEAATLETREDMLTRLYSIDFDADVISFIHGRKFSYDDLEKTVQAVKAKLSGNARPGLDRIEAQQDSYPGLSFDEISSLLTDLEDGADRAQETITDGRAYQTTFLQLFFASDLGIALDSYNGTFDELSALVRSSELYQKAIDGKQREVSTAGLDLEIASTLSKSLESIRDVGIDNTFETFLSRSRRDYEGRIAHKDSQVNNSVTGFLFRKSKVEAQAAYDSAFDRQYSPDALLNPKYAADFASCKLSTRELQGKWLSIKQAMGSSSASREQYEKIPFSVAEANALADQLGTSLDRCLNAPPSPTPVPPKQTDYTTPILVVAFVAVAAYFFLRMRQQQRPADEEE